MNLTDIRKRLRNATEKTARSTTASTTGSSLEDVQRRMHRVLKKTARPNESQSEAPSRSAREDLGLGPTTTTSLLERIMT